MIRMRRGQIVADGKPLYELKLVPEVLSSILGDDGHREDIGVFRFPM